MCDLTLWLQGSWLTIALEFGRTAEDWSGDTQSKLPMHTLDLPRCISPLLEGFFYKLLKLELHSSAFDSIEFFFYSFLAVPWPLCQR